jgi:hypothetical protein
MTGMARVLLRRSEIGLYMDPILYIYEGRCCSRGGLAMLELIIGVDEPS